MLSDRSEPTPTPYSYRASYPLTSFESVEAERLSPYEPGQVLALVLLHQFVHHHVPHRDALFPDSG